MRILVPIILLLFPSCLFAQVEINNPIIFSSENDEERKVKNLNDDITLSRLANAKNIQKGNFQHLESIGINLLEINSSLSFDSYIRGMQFYIKVENANTGPVQLNINEIGEIPLKKKVIYELAPNDILPGQIIQVIFDGEYFQLLSAKGKKCPSGFSDANSSYCIETSPRSSQLFYDAVETCNEMNARLCSWGEWFYACNNNEVEFTTNSNWEWTNSNKVTRVHVNVVGSGNNCFTNTTRSSEISTGHTASFRCCYDY